MGTSDMILNGDAKMLDRFAYRRLLHKRWVEAGDDEVLRFCRVFQFRRPFVREPIACVSVDDDPDESDVDTPILIDCSKPNSR